MKHRIGLVLDGGGGKGAYQVGVWHALREIGLEKYVTDVAGSSVGELNAALFVKGNLEEAEKIWLEEISEIKVHNIQMVVSQLIDEHLSDMSFFDRTPRNCFLTVKNKSGINQKEYVEETVNKKSVIKYVVGDAEYFNMRHLDKKERVDSLKGATMRKSVMLATSALPILCTSLEIDGQHYEDGGYVDNSPALPLVKATKCDTIVVIHLDTEKDIYRESQVSSDVTVLEIVPSGNTGGLFNGTINFDTEHARQLINMGYNDAKPIYENLIRNWKKEEWLTESDQPMYKIIDTLSPEEKYRLYNECEFLLHGNYAKLKYISDSESGFGKMIWRTITGSYPKCKKQVLENSAALQAKMMKILTCLDDQLFNMDQIIRFQFNRDSKMSDLILDMHRQALDYTEILSYLVKRDQYIEDFLEKHYPDFYKGEGAPVIETKLNDIVNNINHNIEEINNLNEEAIKRQEALEAQHKSKAKQVRLLRLTPEEKIVLSPDGVKSSSFKQVNSQEKRWNIINQGNYKNACKEESPDLIILPIGVPHFLVEQQYLSIPRIPSADYFMYLWFQNTPEAERAGKSICMIDYQDHNIYVYGYKISDDGFTYKKIEDIGSNKISENLIQSNGFIHKIIDIFGFQEASKFSFYRAFINTPSGENDLESKMNNAKGITINKVDPKWENALEQNDGENYVNLVDKFFGRVYD